VLDNIKTIFYNFASCSKFGTFRKWVRNSNVGEWPHPIQVSTWIMHIHVPLSLQLKKLHKITNNLSCVEISCKFTYTFQRTWGEIETQSVIFPLMTSVSDIARECDTCEPIFMYTSWCYLPSGLLRAEFESVGCFVRKKCVQTLRKYPQCDSFDPIGQRLFKFMFARVSCAVKWSVALIHFRFALLNMMRLK
jgi:hypothetical protein